MSQLHALEPARCAVITPANTYYVFVFDLSHSFASSTWRSWLNFFELFFRSRKLSQLDAIELERCCWGSSFPLSEPAIFSQCVQLPGSVPHGSFNRDGTPVAAQKVRSHVLGQICFDSGTTLKSYDPLWNWASYMFWANSKMRKIVDCYIQV